MATALVTAAVSGAVALQQQRTARRAQRKQEARIAKQEADVKKVEEGQRKVANSGGGGLLAHVDDRLKQSLGAGESGLKKLLG